MAPPSSMRQLVVLAVAAFCVGGAAAQPESERSGDRAAGTAPNRAERICFVVLGDAGPVRGARAERLAEAVELANWLDPDFVIATGGALHAGDPDGWRAGAEAYTSVMSGLRAPWHLVAADRDVAAGPGRPDGHAELFRARFGPLHHAFDHRFARVVVLFSRDLGSGVAGIPPEQVAWLADDLAATDRSHLFVVVHHPLWTERFGGSNWEAVHQLLRDDGRPATVIAGHVRHLRDDGRRDNVRYLTIATTGAPRSPEHDQTSFDHVLLVRAGHDEVFPVVIPLDAVRPIEHFPGSEADAIDRLRAADAVQLRGELRVSTEPGDAGSVLARIHNPADKQIRYVVGVDAPTGWSTDQRRLEGTLPPGGSKDLTLDFRSAGVGEREPRVELAVRAAYPLSSDAEQIVSQRVPIVVRPAVDAVGVGDANAGLRLDGASGVRVRLDGPTDRLTLECWVRGSAPAGRAGLITKNANSGFGLFWSDDPGGSTLPTAYVHVGDDYVEVEASEPWAWDRWTHLALTYDGAAVRLWVNGRLAGAAPASGPITANTLPLVVGAGVDARGRTVDHFTGRIDEVRLSAIARYDAPFSPPRICEPDADTLLLLHLDHDTLPGVGDAGPGGRHGWATGRAVIERMDRP